MRREKGPSSRCCRSHRDWKSEVWRRGLCADVLLFFSPLRINHPRHRKCLLRHDNIERGLPVEKEGGGHSPELTAHQHRDQRHVSANQGQGEAARQDSVLTEVERILEPAVAHKSSFSVCRIQKRVKKQANQVLNESPSPHQDVLVSGCINAFLTSSSEEWSC